MAVVLHGASVQRESPSRQRCVALAGVHVGVSIDVFAVTGTTCSQSNASSTSSGSSGDAFASSMPAVTSRHFRVVTTNLLPKRNTGIGSYGGLYSSIITPFEMVSSPSPLSNILINYKI